MKKSLFKKLTKMARDGDPEAIEALAEAVEEIIETPSAEPDAPEVAVVAAAVAPDPAPAAAEPAPVEVEAETAAVTVDADTLTAILERLDQLIALLAPAAADEDPAEPAAEDLPEELAEVVEEALEAVEETSGEPALEEAAEEVAAVVEEVLTEGEHLSTASGGIFERGEVSRNKRAPQWGVAPIEAAVATVLEPESTGDETDDPESCCAGDALRTALRAVRPALKKMSPKDRRKVTADIAARLSRKDAAHNRRYAALNDAKTTRASSYTDLGKQIMQKRNPNYRG